jgi:hypothetical protein
VTDLNAMAADGGRLLAELTSSERDALARGYLRFRVDTPVTIDVAARDDAIPFWLADQGFRRTGDALEVLGERWALFRMTAPAGWVGLGVNGLDRKVRGHYVVFLRPRSGTRPPRVTDITPDQWRMAAAGAGVSALCYASVPIRSLPPALRGAIVLQPSRELRHASILARGRVWKTHLVSSRRPDQLAIAFGADASRTLAWTWRTAPEVASTALRIAPADHSGHRSAIKIVRGTSQLVETPSVLNDPAIRRHRVELADLRPDTLYAYSAGDGSPEGWTEWRTVRTGPEAPRSYRFLYMGDAQCGLEGWGKLLHDAAARFPSARFLLMAGDLVDRGNERTNWDHFFLRAAGVFDTLPMMPCAGNHEYLDQGPRLYSAFFALPRNGPQELDPKLVYSSTYANTFFAVLDSTLAVSDARLARVQAEWLDRTLGQSKADWKFVMFHHPVYASHPTRESPALQKAWTPVFDKHHVDVVFQGHDHAYLRTYPIRAHQRVASNDSGTIYVVSVAGDKFYDQDPRDYTAVGLTHVSTYQTIDVEFPRNRLVYRAWDGRGREVDRFVIEKPPVGAGVLAERNGRRQRSSHQPDARARVR